MNTTPPPVAEIACGRCRIGIFPTDGTHVCDPADLAKACEYRAGVLKAAGITLDGPGEEEPRPIRFREFL